MEVALKIGFITCLALVTYQDFRERQVWFFLFPLCALVGGYLFFKEATPSFYFTTIAINLGIVSLIVFLNFLVARFVLKKSLLKEALGLGDILFFIVFAISFPTFAFLNFFVFSLVITWVLYIVIRMRDSRIQTAPLAGCMALFLMGIYGTYWMGFLDALYLI